MFTDQQTVLWDAAALTTTAYSTNSFDCGAIPSNASANGAAPDISVGTPMAVVMTVGVAPNVATGDETYEFDITESASPTPSTSPTILAKFPFTTAQATAILTVGAVIVLPIPPNSITQRYLSCNYVPAGTSPSITVTAWITKQSAAQILKYYSSAVVIK